MSKFKVGDKVRKITGYPFVGTVCATYDTEEKCCVKHADKWEHIFSDKQLVLDHQEYQYLDLLQECIETGNYREGRNGGTYSLFGKQMRFDLSKGFPLFTTKKLHFKSIVVELLWMLKGYTNTKYLRDNGVTIWDEWADENGDLGPVYGAQWRDHKGVFFGKTQDHIITNDQISNLLISLRDDPYGRRHIVSSWTSSQLNNMALPPCHCLFQFYISDGKLSCQLYQRSADLFLGVPFNVASYALLTRLIAETLGLEVGEFVHTFGDVHLYSNHIEQAREQISRIPFDFPEISISKDLRLVSSVYESELYNLTYEDISLHNYQSHPHIKAEVSK